MSLDWSSAAVGAVSASIGAVVLYVISKAVSFEAQNFVGIDHTRRGLKVVITGGTRGLGLELAKSFLNCGDDVLLAARDADRCQVIQDVLRKEYPERVVAAVPCDVSDAQQVEHVAQEALKLFSRVDIWINNAAVSANTKMPLTDTTSSEYSSIVQTNLIGSMNGAASAMRVMSSQSPPDTFPLENIKRLVETPVDGAVYEMQTLANSTEKLMKASMCTTGGKIFLVDGAGARGTATAKNAAYGATKRALTQLKLSLATEVKGTPTSVHIFSPGMVATDLLLKPHLHDARVMKAFNMFAEDPAVTAAWLVPRLRAVKGNGSYISFLTPLGICWRLLTAARRRGRFDHFITDPLKR